MAQSTPQLPAEGRQNDAVYPPDFDCKSLAAPQAQVECATYQHNMLSNPPTGTPAIPLPGTPNAIDGVPRNKLDNNRPNNGEGVGTKGSGAGIDRD
jgi:hypothetical protein